MISSVRWVENMISDLDESGRGPKVYHQSGREARRGMDIKLSQRGNKRLPHSANKRLSHSVNKRLPHSVNKRLSHSVNKRLPHSVNKRLPHTVSKRLPHGVIHHKHGAYSIQYTIH